MSDLIIRQLFESRLLEWADQRDLPVELQNQDFTPPQNADPADNTHLQSFLLPANTTSEDLAGAHTAFQGVFQVNVVIARNLGAGPAGLITAGLFDLFRCNLRLIASSGFTLRVTTPLRVRAGIAGGSTYTVPTDFAYRADTF